MCGDCNKSTRSTKSKSSSGADPVGLVDAVRKRRSCSAIDVVGQSVLVRQHPTPYTILSACASTDTPCFIVGIRSVPFDVKRNLCVVSSDKNEISPSFLCSDRQASASASQKGGRGGIYIEYIEDLGASRHDKGKVPSGSLARRVDYCKSEAADSHKEAAFEARRMPAVRVGAAALEAGRRSIHWPVHLSARQHTATRSPCLKRHQIRTMHESYGNHWVASVLAQLPLYGAPGSYT